MPPTLRQQIHPQRSLRLAVLIACLAAACTLPAQDVAISRSPGQSFSPGDVAAVQQLGDTLGVAEWMGPLAPVALSPFFGITCLAGMSLYGQGWVSADNAFLGEGSPLHNPAVMWIFLGLTLLTSVPRFTKVSKPFAQAVDHVEAWSGIVTMVVLRFLLSADPLPAESPDVVQLGLISMTANIALSFAAAINIFVISTIRFFFEILIWLTPFPAIDAIFEIANKTACGILMAIYGYSPTVATALNAAMFIAAAILFRWVYRREVFFRVMLFDALLTLCLPPGRISDTGLTVFPAQAVSTIPARARCNLRRTPTGWTLTRHQLLFKSTVIDLAEAEWACEVERGWMTNRVKFSGVEEIQLTFSRRLNSCLPELSRSLSAQAPDSHRQHEDRGNLRAELA